MRDVRAMVLVGCVAGCAALAACAKGERQAAGAPALDTLKWSGLYVSDTLPGVREKKVLRLAVGRDTVAAVSLEFVGLGTTLHPGRWSASGDRITMQPTRGDGTPNEYPFTWRLEGSRLIPVDWDHRIYGEQGIPLTRQAAPAAPADSTGAKR